MFILKAFSILTGFSSVEIKTNNLQWTELLLAFQNNSLIGLNCEKNTEIDEIKYNEMKLAFSHAYSILKVIEFNLNKLILVKNP